VIVVVGSPVERWVRGSIVAGGPAVAVAAAAVRAGAGVELVAKVGDGREGDAIVLSLAEAGIGHVAVNRTVGRETIDERTTDDRSSESLDTLAGLGGTADGSDEADLAPRTESPTGLALDAADIQLALRYLPDYDVVVTAQPLDEAATTAVVEAATWANARLIVIGSNATMPLPTDATILDPPGEDAEGAFATVVGRYAAALDRGEDPGDAFAAASRELGWTPVGTE